MLTSDEICRNVASALRKWKTILRFPECVTKFRENVLKFSKSNKLLIVQLIFSVHSLVEAGGVVCSIAAARWTLRRRPRCCRRRLPCGARMRRSRAHAMLRWIERLLGFASPCFFSEYFCQLLRNSSKIHCIIFWRPKCGGLDSWLD